MPERLLADRVVHASQKVQIEQVLPRFPAQWPGFDLRQAEIPQRKSAQSLKQRPRRITSSENQRCLPGLAVARRQRATRPVEQEEAREVFPVILNSALQNLGAINLSRH